MIKLIKDIKPLNIFCGRLIKNLTLTIAFFGISIVPFAVLADDSDVGPRPGLKPLDPNGYMRISSQDRCPVCAMWVSKYKKFAAAIELMNGKTFYFCSNGCMIRCWIHPDIYLGAAKEELKKSVVQDYFTAEQTTGRSVYWVAGSDVIGPMGPAFVTLKDKQHLEVFKKRHGAKAVFLLSEMTDEKWQQLIGNQEAPSQ